MAMKTPAKVGLASAALVAAAFVVPQVAGTSYPYEAPQGLMSSASTDESLDMAWKPVENAPRYRLRVSTSADMSNSKYYRTEGAANTRKITGLTKGTWHYVKVRVISETGEDLSAYSPYVKVKTSPFTISPPTDLLADAIVKNGATFRWDAAAEAPKYRIAVASNPEMESAKYYQTPANETELKVSDLNPSTNYFVKVRAITADGAGLSAYSGAHPFTTAPADVEPTPTPSPSPPPPSDGTINKVLLFAFENKGFTQVQRGMPFAVSMAKQYGLMTAHKAHTHPSLPNYMVWAFGSTQGVSSNISPGSKTINAPTVFGGAVKNGRTAKTYADGMPSNCYRHDGGTRYSPRHVPHTHADSEYALCKQIVVPYASNFSGDAASGNFPNVGMVVPNNCNNTHDCSLRTGDEWFRARWNIIQKSPDWKSGKLLVIFTWDEDNKSEGNRVFTAMIHPSIRGKVFKTPINHASISRLYSDVGHSPRLVNAKTAPDIPTILGLKVE